MKVFLAALAITASSSVLAADPWSTEDKAMYAAYTALRIVDMGQTLNIARNPDKFHERNPLLGSHPSEGKVAGFFIGSHIVMTVAAHYMPSEYRKWFLRTGTVIELGMVGNNAKLGVKVDF